MKLATKADVYEKASFQADILTGGNGRDQVGIWEFE
jgi:hypothetical protein